MMTQSRLEKIRTILDREHLEAIVIDCPIDLFYLTGLELSLGRLIIEKDEATLFVDGRYYEGCRAHLLSPVFLSNGFGKESPFGSWWKFSNKRVGFDADYTSYKGYEQLSLLNGDLVPLKNPVKKIREIKEKKEIEALKQAAILGSQGYDYLLTILHEGITEQEVARALELFWIKQGGDRLAFAPHIAFGKSSSQPHYRPSSCPLKKGDIVLIDIGVVCHHYHSDMTRVVFCSTPHHELEKIYQIVLEASQNAMALCRPGTPISALDQAARGVIEKAGYKEYFTHNLGHGVGLEIHELPILRPDVHEPLQEGMVITIEPGIYLPEIGGVRLEETILITNNGYENLTQRPLSSTPVALLSP